MTVRIGTSEPGGTFHRQGGALKLVLDRDPSLRPIQVLECRSASIENAHRLHRGEIDFGFMAANWIGRAYKGESPFNEPLALSMASPMNAGPLFFVVPATSGLRAVSDLRGRRIAVGPQTSGMVQHAQVILGVLGMSFAEITPLYLDFAAGARALMAGEVDAQFQCPIPNAVMTELDTRMALRVLPYDEGQLETLLAAVSFYRRTVMRKGALRALEADLPQLVVINVLVTHARVPDNVVRQVVTAILAHTAELGRLNALFLGLRELFEPLQSDGVCAFEFGGVPLHPGAVRAYSDAGLLRG
ncbi:MAG: TAXI family TRAP transporter solute-binding subunit [Xanthobacteraceae bacterium]